MKRVALISTDQQTLKDEEHLDTGPLNDALNASGVDSEIAVWHEPRDWSVYDAAIFRSPGTMRNARRSSWTGWGAPRPGCA